MRTISLSSVTKTDSLVQAFEMEATILISTTILERGLPSLM